MRVKISEQAATAIEAALATVQTGRSSRDLRERDVRALAISAEARLEKLKIPKKYRKGARYEAAGPGAEAMSYRNPITQTLIEIERGSTGWFLIGASKIDQHPRSREIARLTLTPEHDRIACQALRNGPLGFSIQPVSSNPAQTEASA